MKTLNSKDPFEAFLEEPPNPEALLGVQDYYRLLKAVQEWAIGSGFTIEQDMSPGLGTGRFSLTWQGVTLFEQLDFAGVITVCSHMTRVWENLKAASGLSQFGTALSRGKKSKNAK